GEPPGGERATAGRSQVETADAPTPPGDDEPMPSGPGADPRRTDHAPRSRTVQQHGKSPRRSRAPRLLAQHLPRPVGTQSRTGPKLTPVRWFRVEPRVQHLDAHPATGLGTAAAHRLRGCNPNDCLRSNLPRPADNPGRPCATTCPIMRA